MNRDSPETHCNCLQAVVAAGSCQEFGPTHFLQTSLELTLHDCKLYIEFECFRKAVTFVSESSYFFGLTDVGVGFAGNSCECDTGEQTLLTSPAMNFSC